jgi:hypothetical protein
LEVEQVNLAQEQAYQPAAEKALYRAVAAVLERWEQCLPELPTVKVSLVAAEH